MLRKETQLRTAIITAAVFLPVRLRKTVHQALLLHPHQDQLKVGLALPPEQVKTVPPLLVLPTAIPKIPVHLLQE